VSETWFDDLQNKLISFRIQNLLKYLEEQLGLLVILLVSLLVKMKFKR
jgi:hypothetical protein